MSMGIERTPAIDMSKRPAPNIASPIKVQTPESTPPLRNIKMGGDVEVRIGKSGVLSYSPTQFDTPLQALGSKVDARV